MIEFKTIKWKNLLSYGNNTNEFNFEEGIYKIQAKNGMGKSSIVEAVYFSLFGKPYRNINMKQLINSKNKKGLWVELTIQKQDDTYRIERGLKPDKFLIFKNDDDHPIPVESTKRGYQQILEEDILGFTENFANQVLIKSLTKTVAFMTLKKAEKRAIIENMFDIEIFSTISKNLKVRADGVELQLNNTKKDIDNTTLLIEQEIANLEQLTNLQRKLKAESDQIVAGFQKEIDDLLVANTKFEKGIEIIKKNKIKKEERTKELNELQTKRTAIENEEMQLQVQVETHKGKIDFLQKTCGECPKIKSMMVDDGIAGVEKRLVEVRGEKQKLRDDFATLAKEFEKLNEILGNERFVTTSLQTNISKIAQLEKQIKAVREKVITVDESKLKGYNKKKSELSTKYQELANDKTHLVLLRSLFGDDGIKPLIIKKYLPYINKLLNTYLTKFNANMVFNFDEDFNEVILTRHKEDYSYFSFSEGEKKRIDLAILFAFIKFAMHKNKKSNTNLLIFDEIMSGLDYSGSTALFEILKEQKDYQNKCVLTINHNSDLDESYFDKMYEVVQESGFSKMVEIK